jgi:small subunit ribosomal protein S20
MPITKSAKKALRRDKRKQGFNKRAKRKAEQAIKAFKKEPSQESLAQAYSAIDKAAKRNIYHDNKVARLKSKLAKMLPSSSKPASGKKKSSGADKMSKKK